MAEHIHRYKRVDIGSRKYIRAECRIEKRPHIVFKCDKPGCSHYLQKALARDQLAECPYCEEPFILDRRALRLARPHCIKCTKGKPVAGDSAISLVEELGGSEDA